VCVLLCCVVSLAEQPRVFITDSHSWEISGGGGGSNGTWGSSVKGGARPQTAEIIKTFGERCKDVVINNKKEKADYIVLLDHEGGKGWIRKDNKVAVFNSEGDSIVSHSTRSLGSSVEDACKAIQNDWAGKGGVRADAKAEVVAPVLAPPMALSGMTSGKMSISSQPAGADIEVDGRFVGNTPSAVVLTVGEHSLTVKKNGYKPWNRKVNITGAEMNVAPELEKVPTADASATPSEPKQQSLGDTARHYREQKPEQPSHQQ
jgi:hypothetical protein